MTFRHGGFFFIHSCQEFYMWMRENFITFSELQFDVNISLKGKKIEKKRFSNSQIFSRADFS